MKRSSVMRSWKSDISHADLDLLCSIVGEDKRNWTLEDWVDRDPALLVRVYTASLWLSQHENALRAATAYLVPST
jgi:hypothetical protein